MRKSDTFLLAACMALTMTAAPALAQNSQNMMGDDHGQGTMGNGGHMQWGPYDGR